MTTMADDIPAGALAVPVEAPARLAGGLALAVVSAASFGMAGALARGLLDTGWTPVAVTLVRIGLAAVLVLPLGLVALRGRWWLLRRNARLLLTYGCLAVAGAQFCYFSAIAHMPVGPAILIEYTAPAAVVVWLWLRQGQRPGRMTVAGAAVAALGLVLVLDLLSGASLSLVGVLFALGAMVGCATHFLVAGDVDNGLPPLALAAGGLVVGAVLLGLLSLVGLLPLRAGTDDASYAGHQVAWWVPLLLLGAVTAAVAYVSGIAAGRRIGSRLASFVGLLEVVFSVAWAWLLLAELPGPVQLVGGLLILAGVVAVKVGEPAAREERAPV